MEDIEYIALVRMYTLFKRIEDADFANSVLDAFTAEFKEKGATGVNVLLSPAAINLIYELHQPSGTMARLLIEAYARAGTAEDVRELTGKVHPSFTHELACVMVGRRGQRAGTFQRLRREDLASQGAGSGDRFEAPPSTRQKAAGN